MKITSAQYLAWENKNTGILIEVEGEQMSVPLDTDNTEYQEIMRQVKEGTLTIKDAE